MSHRVVDKQQIRRHYKSVELTDLYPTLNLKQEPRNETIEVQDTLLTELITTRQDWIVSIEDHESIFEDVPTEKLSIEDIQVAWRENTMDCGICGAVRALNGCSFYFWQRNTQIRE